MPVTVITDPATGIPEGLPFALVTDDALILGATRTDIVNHLHPEHEGLTTEQALHLRHQALEGLVPLLRAGLFNGAVADDPDFVGSLTEDDLNTYLGETSVYDGHWAASAPLVLVRTDYAPFTQRPVPTGNVLFLDPHTEASFLDSLAQAGLIHLRVNEGADEANDQG